MKDDTRLLLGIVLVLGIVVLTLWLAELDELKRKYSSDQSAVGRSLKVLSPDGNKLEKWTRQ